MSVSNSRERILARIREANSIPREQETETPNFDSEIYFNNDAEDTAVIFARQFTNAAGKLVYCQSDEDLYEKLRGFLAQEELQNIYVFEEELSINLDKGGITHFKDTTDFVEKVDAGITYCEYLVARTGSVVVSTKLGGGRMLNVYPPVHIVCANLSQLVYDIDEALKRIDNKYEKNEKPSMISLITGPSRTADIEKTLVMGAHGPKDLVLFLVDDL